jgi:hypothetical protein
MFWDITVNRPIQDWELETLQSFFDLLCSSKVGRDADNWIEWHPAQSNVFYGEILCIEDWLLRRDTLIFS